MKILSAQVTVTTAGTAIALGTQQIDGMICIKALDTNTGVIAIGNDGSNDVTVSNGLRLLPGELIILEHVANLASLIIDASVDGEGVSWLALYP
jgi:hypothetical protein